MDKQSTPNCPVCGKPLNLWKTLTSPIWNEKKKKWVGWYTFCSDKCKNSEVGKLYSKTKHSAECFIDKEKREKIVAKRKKTCLEKYGVKYSTQAKEVIEKKNDTWHKKYENGHPMKDSKKKREIIEKMMIKFYNTKIITNEEFEPLFT